MGEKDKVVEPMLKQGDKVILLFCEECGQHMTGKNGEKCYCGNWLYYHLMLKKNATVD